MMSVDSPIIYSHREDPGHLEGVIDDVERLSIGPKADTPTSVNRTQEIGTCNSPELSQMTSNMAIEQQTGGLVSVEEHAAALETIKHQKELIEKLSKEKGIADESLVHNKQSVEAVEASSQTSLKEVLDDGKEEWIEDIIPAIYSNERMNENGRLKIQTHMKSLWLNIEPRELIIELHSLFVFDEDEFEYLLDYAEKKGRSMGALQMLRKLYRKGPNSYILFLVALERCNHTWVIKTLEPDCVICEGRIKYSGQKYYELIDNTSPKYGEFVRRCEKNIEDVYDDYPGQQFVVVKKLEKGCVEVTFHLISLGYNNEEDLRRPLEDLVKSGSIDTDPVKPDEFYFRQITDEELASKRESMTHKRIIGLEKEIETLKLQIIALQLENAALRGTSANSQEVETYKEHLAKKYTDTLQDKELIISSLIEQLDQQATASNVDIVRADGERLEKENDDNLNEQLDQCESIDWADDERLKLEKEMTIVPIDDYQDEERLHQGKALTVLPVDDDQDKDTVEKGAASTNRKIEQMIDYLVTDHPHKLRPLVQLLKDKDAIDDDEEIIMYIDRGDIKHAARMLSTTLTYTSGTKSYQYLIESVKELGFSDVEDMIDKSRRYKTPSPSVWPGDLGIFQVNLARLATYDVLLEQASLDTFDVEQLKPLGTKKPDLTIKKYISQSATNKKIEQIIDYLVTRHPDKLRPLVELLKDKDVIDDDDRTIIIMYISIGEIKQATRILSVTLTRRPNSYQCLVESLKQLGLSYVLDKVDEGDVDISKPPISVNLASLDKFDVEQLKPLGTKKPDLTIKKYISQSRSSPD